MIDSELREARRERAALFERDAAKARIDHDLEVNSIEERTARLRKARLAREAKLKESEKPTGRAKTSRARSRADTKNGSLPKMATDRRVGQATSSAHLFAVDERVVIAVRRSDLIEAPGNYRIVRQLPPEGGDNLYRIKGEQELHERVVGESRLKPAPV